MLNLAQLASEVVASAESVEVIAGGLEHLQTTADADRKSGTTRWECVGSDGRGWFEWDWVEVMPQVLAQANPMEVRTNLVLLDDHGRPLTQAARIRALSTLVYLLSHRKHPWQQVVLDSLVTKH
ncbi:MAG: hypothetical protein E6R08_09060 [Nevskiaceae bacterium]|nr:MAG: hypothetical protein E6R08_09060 [Nevskiaceae bacterium]